MTKTIRVTEETHALIVAQNVRLETISQTIHRIFVNYDDLVDTLVDDKFVQRSE